MPSPIVDAAQTQGLLSFLNNLPGANAGANPLASGNSGQTTEQGGYNSATDPDLLAHLAAIKKFDPNATIGINKNAGNGGEADLYNVSYDQSKLPKPDASLGQVGGPHGIARIPVGGWGDWNKNQMSTNHAQGIVHSTIDPSLVQSDANYGSLTPGSNVTTQVINHDHNLLDTLGPMVPMLFAGAMNPGLLSSLGGMLGKGVASVPQMLANGKVNPMSFASIIMQYLKGK